MFRIISTTVLALVGMAAVALGIGQVVQSHSHQKDARKPAPKPGAAWPRNNIQHRITSQLVEVQNAYLVRACRLPAERTEVAQREVLLIVNKYMRGLLDRRGQEAFDQAIGWKASPPRGRWVNVAKTPTMVRELLNETPEQALALNNLRAKGGQQVRAGASASPLGPNEHRDKNEKHGVGREWRELAVFREVLTPAQLREYRGFMGNLRREMERAVTP